MRNQPILDYQGPFNIRVYGICQKGDYLLLSDEIFMGSEMTKFPGGGLEYGEGTIACLKREFKEEFSLDIEVIKHFYTTDFFQKAKYFENTQLISIYYLIDLFNFQSIPFSNHPIIAKEESPQNLRFAAIAQINQNDFTFPIDKKVISMLKHKA